MGRVNVLIQCVDREGDAKRNRQYALYKNFTHPCAKGVKFLSIVCSRILWERPPGRDQEVAPTEEEIEVNAQYVCGNYSEIQKYVYTPLVGAVSNRTMDIGSVRKPNLPSCPNNYGFYYKKSGLKTRSMPTAHAALIHSYKKE